MALQSLRTILTWIFLSHLPPFFSEIFLVDFLLPHSVLDTWSRVMSQSLWAFVTKRPQTGWLLSNTALFLTVLEAGQSEFVALQIWCLVRDGFLIHGCLPTAASHRAKKELALGGPYYKGTNPEGCTLMT